MTRPVWEPEPDRGALREHRGNVIWTFRISMKGAKGCRGQRKEPLGQLTIFIRGTEDQLLDPCLEAAWSALSPDC